MRRQAETAQISVRSSRPQWLGRRRGVFLVVWSDRRSSGFLPGMAAASGALCVRSATPRRRLPPSCGSCRWLGSARCCLARDSAGRRRPADRRRGGDLDRLQRRPLIASVAGRSRFRVLTLLSMVFTLGAPPADLAGACMKWPCRRSAARFTCPSAGADALLRRLGPAPDARRGAARIRRLSAPRLRLLS